MKSSSLSTCALLVLSALSANANQLNADNQDDEIESIEVTGHYIKGYNAHDASGASHIRLSIADIPQSVSVITDYQMADFQLNDVNLVLDSATGVNVQRIETDRTYYTARGFDITNFQFDGIGLPLTSGNNHAGEDTAIYDRIEIIRGANGLMTGVGNPSATVNFIRKRPTKDNALNINTTLGSWSNKRLTLDGTYHIDDQLAVRGVITKQKTNSYLDRYRQDRNLGYAFIRYQLSNKTELSLSHAVTDNHATGNNWGANPLYYSDGSATHYDISTNTSADWSNWAVKRQQTILSASHTLMNDWQLKATYSHKSTDEDSELFYVYGTPNKETGLGLKGYASEYDHDENTNLFDVYLTGYFDLFNREHEFVVGVNRATLDYTDKSLYDYTTGNGFPVMPPLSKWDGNTAFPTFKDGATGADIKREQSAFYATARLEINDDLHTIIGGRQNKWQAKGQSYNVVQDASDNEFIPYLGAVYQITEANRVYASYTETFLSQTKLDINDQVLAPITGASKEIGIKSQLFNQKFIATFAYFDIVQKNVAKLDPTTAELSPEMQRYIGVEGISSSGFELDIAGEPIEGLQTSAGYTDFNIKGDDTVANYTPSKLFKLAASYQIPHTNGLSIGANIQWQDDIKRLQGVVAEPFDHAGSEIIAKQKAYALINLMAKYQVSDNLLISFNANNVTDEKYLNSLYWAQGYYGAPSNYSISATWSL
ncbi:TonB-dependent siderophore receptor [Thalassotalea sp. G2M2-11]|uniref:TonB-dependent siderophore receptor n=1 Tax=Thalassotalea sp. G2M2-11 TaxID=2787627 RepID=UPI0019D00220|nr:TonB-dependent siderophore receptor [Thalassotalea sp. G2M2-11]